VENGDGRSRIVKERMKSKFDGRRALLLIVLSLLVFVVACAPAPRCITTTKSRYEKRPLFASGQNRSDDNSQVPTYPVSTKKSYYNPNLRSGSSSPVQQGICSYSGREQHGSPMANGETFNMNRMIGAHRTLPFGTIVRVTNLNNGQSVIIEIKDRGPSKRERIIDISYAAARKIDMIYDGIVPAKVELVRGEWIDDVKPKPDLLVKAKEKFDELVGKILNKDPNQN